MALSRTQKLVMILMTIGCVLATSAEANGSSWSWGWSSNGTGSSWGWGSDSGSGTGSSGTGSGSGWGWGWDSSSNPTGSGSSWDWSWGSNSTSGDSSSGSAWKWWDLWSPKPTSEPRKIVVGGSEGWQYGFNYAEWARENGPFYVNDVLIFKYDPPAPHKHNVYLLPDQGSYEKCDFTSGKMIGKACEGAGGGVEFVLENWQYPYFFACGEGGGSHCLDGSMKFAVTPILRP